jgi:choline dehydrogenase-like flavoprotein
VTSIELTGNAATGVNFSMGSKDYTVKAQSEVIVSCGAIQTPQILELSGIGDPAVLQKAGVACKIENKAVGNNFQDHVLSVSCQISKRLVTQRADTSRRVWVGN